MADTKELGIVVTGDIDDIMNAMSGVLDMLDNLTDKVVNISTNIDSAGIETLESSLDEIDNTAVSADIAVNDTATQLIENVETSLDEIDGTIAVADISINDYASGELIALESLAGETAGSMEQIGTAGDLAVQELSTSLSGAEGSLTSLGNTAQETANKTEQIGQKSEQVGTSAELGFGAAELAVLAFLGTLELSARELDTLNTKFDKMSNMAGSIPEGNLRDMVADLSNISFAGDEVLAYLTALKQAGLETEDSLKRGADAMDIIQEGTGVTQDETIKFLNSLIVMGVDLNNIGESYNAIAYAQGNVVGGFRTYIGWMQKYDATFKEMGLNLDQTAVLISAATKKFGGGRAAYQGLNEAIKESNGDLSILEEKLGMQTGSLSKASETTSVYTGKLEKNRAEVREHATGMQKFGAATEDVGLKWGDFLAILLGGGAAIGAVAGFFGYVIPKAMQSVESLWGGDGKYAKMYMDFMKNQLAKMKDFGTKMADIIRGWAGGWGKAAEEGGSTVGTKLLNSADDIARAGTKGGTQVVEILDAQGNVIGETIVKIGDDVSGATPEVTSRIGSFFARIRGLFGEGWGLIVRLTPDWIAGVGRAIATGVGRLGLGEVLTSLGKFALPKLALTGDVAFVAGLEQVRAGLVDMSIDLWDADTAVGSFQRDFLAMSEGVQYATPGFGNAIASLDLLNGVIDNLLEGKGWDSFGIAFTDLRDRLNRDAQALSDMFQRVFGVELPDVLNPVKIFEMLFTFNFQEMWDNSIFGGTYTFPDISAGASGFLGTLAQYMSVEALLGAVVSGWDGLLDYLQGIPDRILGAIGNVNWFSIGAGLGDAVAWVLENIYYFLQALIAFPGQAYTSIVNLGQSIYNGLVAIPGQIQGGINNAMLPLGNFYTWLTLLPGRAYNAVVGLGQYIYNGLMAIPGQVQAGLLNIWNQFLLFITWIQTLPQQLVDGVTNGFNGMVNYIATIPEQVTNALNQIIQRFLDFVNYLASLPGQFYNAIVNAFNGFISGLSSKFPEISYWLGKIADLFPHSPPKAGPLIDIMDWGGNMASAIGDGITKNFPVVSEQFVSQLNDLKKNVTFSDINPAQLALPTGSLDVINATMQQNIATPGTSPVGGVQGTGGTTIHVHVSLEGAIINSERDENQIADNIGTRSAKKLSDELTAQASRGGVSVINERR